MILYKNMSKRVGESSYPCQTPNVIRNQFSVEEDGTSGLLIEVFDDSDRVGTDIVLLQGCPQSCMPNPVEGLLEVYEDMVRGLASAEDVSLKGFVV